MRLSAIGHYHSPDNSVLEDKASISVKKLCVYDILKNGCMTYLISNERVVESTTL